MNNEEPIKYTELPDGRILAQQGKATWYEAQKNVPFQRRARHDRRRMFNYNLPLLKKQGRVEQYDHNKCYSVNQAGRGLIITKPADNIAALVGWPDGADELLLLSVYKRKLNCTDKHGRDIEILHYNSKDRRMVDEYSALSAVKS